MSQIFNRARMTTATTGVGTITLGAAVSDAYFTFAEAGVQNGDVVSYCIEDGNDVEVGTGTYTASGTTLTRTVTASKIGGVAGTSAINLSGSATVFITARAEDLPTLNSNGGIDLSTGDGIDVNPGSDADADLLTVGVTGAPTLSWDESADAFKTNKPLNLPNTGLHLLDTGGDHDYIIAPGEDATADRTLTLNLNDADRTLSLTGNTTLAGGTHSGTNTGDETAATTSASGIVELATTAEVNTGTDTGRVPSVDVLAGSYAGTKSIQMVVFDFGTAVSTGDGAFYFHVPSALAGMDLVAVHAEVISAGTTGTTDIQIHNVTDAVDMLSTKLTIDSGETGSDTAATPAVINTSNDDVVENDLLRIDVDAVSTTPPDGLIVTMEFRLP